jgi:CHASE3 domain sensor protein
VKLALALALIATVVFLMTMGAAFLASIQALQEATHGLLP